MFKENTVQITRGKYQWSYGTIISIGDDNIVLVQIEDDLTISCDVSELDLITT